MSESPASQEFRSSEGKQIKMSNNSYNDNVLNVKINTSDKVDSNKYINGSEKPKENSESTCQTEGKAEIRQEASSSTRKR